MPAVIAKGAIVVITVVAAAAIAVYESPEVRQFAEDCRRRIAIALHSLGDEINPNGSASSESQQPRFNRPEDAEGFMQSRGESGVDADEASRRRQREELMYWNQIRLEKIERERKRNESQSQNEKTRSTRGSNFDDFLQQDKNAEAGTYVYNTSADIHNDDNTLRRRSQGVRGLDRGAVFANPFADENHIELEGEEQRAADARLMAPSPVHSEFPGDLYGVSDDGMRPSRETTTTHTLTAHTPSQLVDTTEAFATPAPSELPTPSPAVEEPYMTAQNAHPDVFASIHAWADNSTHSHNASFYSPLPVTPQVPISEPELLSGQATPRTADSFSVAGSVSGAGSGEDLGDNGYATSSVGEDGRYYDVMSEDGEGVSTPGSWTEVGSVVSENDARHH